MYNPFPYRFTKDVFFKRLFISLFLVAIGYIIYQLQSVILPFLVAFILSYAINPLVQKLQDKAHIRRWVAILLVYLSTGLMIGLILWWLIPLVWEQLQSAWKYVPTAIDYYNNTLRGWVRSHTPIRLPALQVRDMSKGLVDFLKEHYNIIDVRSFFTNLMLSGMNIINVAGIVVLVPILMFYFLYNWDERLVKMRHMIPNRYILSVYRIAKESDEALMSFIKGQILVMVLLGMVYAVQLQLIGLKVGLIIGMMAGIASFVPYLGFTLGFIAAIIAGLFQFGVDWVHLLLIIGAFMVGQAVEGYVLQPLLLGDKIGLSPLWVMFAVLAGASLAGIAGMLIALPLAAVLKVLFQHAYDSYRETEFYKGDAQYSLFKEENLMDIKLEQQQKKIEEQMKKENTSWIARIKNIF
ncbi:AI-2E family transporter [Moraxella osloensis]|nr:AI-2E family transporter [Enhydrobacter sp. 8BJ]QCR85634.1 AI-2E family transporter [Moraxella osloensis]VXB06423.1 Putative permease often clustered with de novo purine synthesis [Enhydrobacter sp. 8BJ]